MPKAFTHEERTFIREKLMVAGLRHFERGGVRSLRIDELCRDVGIAKGSFYGFFPSKEALYFALAEQRDAQHKKEMMAEIVATPGGAEAALGTLFDSMLKRLETDPLIRIVRDSGEFAYLIRHAPPNYIADNLKNDRLFFMRLADEFEKRFGLKYADAQTLEGATTLLMTLSLQEDYLRQTETYALTVRVFREMFISRLIEGPSHD